MASRDYPEIIGGATLAIVGVLVVIVSVDTLRMGTLIHMGPGMFPTALGCILAALGVIIMIPGFSRSGAPIDFEFRAFVTVIGSILLFAALVEPFGMVPAIVVLTFVASRADNKLSIPGVIALAACLSVGATLVFQIGLGIPLKALNWPW